MTLTKSDIIHSIYINCDFSKTKSTELTEAILATIMATLESGEDFLISGFGKFSVKEKNERIGRNPATGDDLMLRVRRVITFRCSSVLREKINGEPWHTWKHTITKCNLHFP